MPRAGPPQPSPEELRRQREAQDLQEAADDALDRGVAAYRRGDYSTAALKFEESLQYNPDDPVAQQNLDQARQRLQEAFVQESARAAAAEQAQRQRLNSLSGSATREGVAAHAGQADPIFDGRRGARDMGGIAVGSGAAVVGASVRDPVVPQARMTPAIASFERQRTEQRARITAIDAEVRTLNPTMHATRIERRRQERAQAESQVTFINFSINEALSAPPPSQGAGN